MPGFELPVSGHRTETEPIQFLDTLSFVHVASEETDGRWSVVEMQLREGHAPPLHIHENADELIHVTDGTIHVHTEDDQQELTAESSVVLPRGEPHSLHAVTEATIVTADSPGGFGEFVTAVGEPTEDRTVPTAPPSEAAIGRVNELAPEHDIRIVGPPPVGP
ncbi:cupin domain-containing protein [Halorubrum tibetense]|uniref:Cupin domain-containing protein n=1 Tax=Halorubrum tibetense TaxID=175631 RepID=A0ABD5S7Q2_9EURY